MSKAVSVRQPWAWAISRAGKDVENRAWSTMYRGELYIHAGKTVERFAVGQVVWLAGCALPEEFATDGLVGKVRLVDVHHADECFTTCSPWAEPGCWHWVLVDRQRLPALVPCRGRLGLFRPVEADDTTWTWRGA